MLLIVVVPMRSEKGQDPGLLNHSLGIIIQSQGFGCLFFYACVTEIGNPKEVRLTPPAQTCDSAHGDLFMEASVCCHFSVSELCRLLSSQNFSASLRAGLGVSWRPQVQSFQGKQCFSL